MGLLVNYGGEEENNWIRKLKNKLWYEREGLRVTSSVLKTGPDRPVGPV
jgi:hypothetical protein